MRVWLVAGWAIVAVACGADRNEDAPCAGVMCGASPPPVALRVVDATSSAAVEGVVLVNVSSPAALPGSGGPVGCATGPTETTCVVYGQAPGTYAFDVTAPGYVTAHLTVDVSVHEHVPGVCCEPALQAQTIDVRLSPAA